MNAGGKQLGEQTASVSGSAATDPQAPPGLVALQRRFAAHLRNPARHAAPANIETRRLRIYAELVYNNIEGFLASGFPVLRKLHSDAAWRDLVRGFIDSHCSQTPYFTRVAAEFVDHLADQASTEDNRSVPDFMVELAQYEWAELALFLAEGELPPCREPAPADADMLSLRPRLSPLAWPMVFHYPVHEIGPGNVPHEPSPLPVCLVIYRNRAQVVEFLQLDTFTARLLELVDDEAGTLSCAALIDKLAAEIPQMPYAQIASGVPGVLAKLYDLDIIHFA